MSLLLFTCSGKSDNNSTGPVAITIAAAKQLISPDYFRDLKFTTNIIIERKEKSFFSGLLEHVSLTKLSH